MPIPNVKVELYLPGAGWRDVSAACSLESSIEIAEAIEGPTETNAFVAPNVLLKLVADGSGVFTFDVFANLLPESTNYLVRISRDGVVFFYGFVLPNTLQFDDAERWASFTAVGIAGKLARTSAENATSLKRATSSGWTVVRTVGNSWRAEVEIEKLSPQSFCEYVTDDRLALDIGGGKTLEVKVVTVRGVGTSAPFDSFMLTVEGLDQLVGAGAAVTLLTPFRRNVDLRVIVDALLVAAGLNATTAGSFLVAPLAGAAAPFATTPDLTGLLGTPLAVIPNVYSNPRYHPVIGTTLGTFIQYDPPLGDWVQAPGYLQGQQSEPVDWTDTNTFATMGYALYGPRFEQYAVTPTDPESDYAYVSWYYHVASTSMPSPAVRFGIIVEVGNITAAMPDFPFAVSVARDTSTDGVTWTRSHTVSVLSGTTKENLHTFIGDVVGISTTSALSSASRNRVLFTYPIGGERCEYAIGYCSVTDLSGRVEWLVGPRGRCHMGSVWQIDSRYESEPKVVTLNLSEFGVPVSIRSTRTLPAGFQPNTLTYNPGDGYWYALASTNDAGVVLLSYESADCAPRAGYVPAQIEPPGGAVSSALDLTCVRTPTLPPGAWPMVALCNGTVWWIAYAFAGLIPYADVEGLSCGEAIAQLVTLLDAFAYVDRDNVSWVKSRSTTSSRSIITGTTGTSTRIDDGGCLKFRRASIWYKSYRFVRVENERDETVFGEAGDESFRDTEQALTLTSRFVTTQSFATALAQNLLSYLGRKLAAVDVEHEMDERRYEIGRWFTASIDGVVKTFQVIEATPRPLLGTVRVQGLEM